MQNEIAFWTWSYAPSAFPSTCCWSASRATWIASSNACSCDAVCSAISFGNATGPSSRARSFFLRRVQSAISRRDETIASNASSLYCKMRRTISKPMFTPGIHCVSLDCSQLGAMGAIFKSRPARRRNPEQLLHLRHSDSDAYFNRLQVAPSWYIGGKYRLCARRYQ